MNIRFEPNPQLAPDTVNVTVEAAKLNAEALQVLQLLEENQMPLLASHGFRS